MRARVWTIICACLILILLLGKSSWGSTSFAAEDTNRHTEILIAYTQNEWWLIRWSDNRPVCRVYTDHDGVPTDGEIQFYCTDAIYKDWQNTSTCTELDAKNPQPDECTGLYLHFIGSEPSERTLLVNLPEPQVWVSLSGCDPIPLKNICKNLPYLKLVAQEPLPNEYITSIYGTYDGDPFSCPSDICEIPLKPTTPQGVQVEFWADSSYGDSSPQYQALVRVIDTGVTTDPAEAGWYVDVLSTQWLGDGVVASCSQSWQAFPPVGGVPPWLANPDNPEDLVSTEPYAYLAGRLISSGLVDASQCPSGGLLENGWANVCGVEQARADVDAWQNDFDEQIINAALQARIPSQLLKNIFAQESQFWPGAVQDLTMDEYGFGRLTELGADTVLLWNPEFYAQFCPLVLDASVCANGYAQLSEDEQAILRGAVVVSADANCVDCEAGIDLSYTGFNIGLFAQIIKANCAQTGQIVENATGVIPGGITNYDDLWRFTLVNYHAGPGCLGNAVQATFDSNQAMNWLNVSSNLEPGCDTAITFVDNITTMQAAPATPTPVITEPVIPATPTPVTPPPAQATPTPEGTTTGEPYPPIPPTQPPLETITPYPYPP
jgi:hypothetical protein